MRALRVVPGIPGSAELAEMADPEPDAERPYLVESILVGLCGTDRELLRRTPPAEQALTIGHESLGRIVNAPSGGGLGVGDFVVGVIRSRCHRNCRACQIDRFDLCTTRPIVERGIYGLDGFGSDLWTSSERGLVGVPRSLADYGVLTEPLTSLIKARRKLLDAQSLMPTAARDRVLISGAGTIGILAAWLFGDVFNEVDIVDINPDPKAIQLIANMSHPALHTSWDGIPSRRYDAFFECSGSTSALERGVGGLVHGGIAVLEGICSPADHPVTAQAFHELVLNDITILATVNASRSDHELAVSLLTTAPKPFLAGMITSELRPGDWMAWAQSARWPGVKTTVRFDL